MRRAAWATILLATLALAAAVGAPEQELSLLDGRGLRGSLTSIDARQVVIQAGGKAETLPRDEVITITFVHSAPPDLLTEPGRKVLLTDDGSRFGVSEVTLAGGTLSATNPAAGAIRVPLERVVRLLVPRTGERPADLQRQCDTLGLKRGATDYVVISNKPGQYAPVAGVLKTLDSKQIVFQYEGAETAMDAATVAVIQTAGASAAPAAPAGELECPDGSRIAFADATFASGKVRLTGTAAGELTVAAGSIAALRFRSAKFAYLSDLAPAEARQVGYFGESQPHVKDRAVGGGPLVLGGTRFEKGLGLHTRCELTWDLGGQYRRLVATAGIDDASPLGTAYLTILGDGKPLVSRLRLDRKAAPQPVAVDVSGVKRLVVLAEFGDGGFGAGERVDLADAKLIR